MAGQNANVNVTFTSSGAGGVVGDAQAVQGAISGITGKTVGVDYAGKGGAAATREAQAFSQAVGGAQASAAGLGRETERATRSVAGLGREAQATRSHMQALRDDVRAVGQAFESVGSRSALSSGARQARQDLSGASRAVGELESGAGRAAVAVRQVHTAAGGIGGGSGGGGIKSAIIDMQKLSDGTWGVAEGMKAIGSRDLRHGGANDLWADKEAPASRSEKAPGSAAGRDGDHNDVWPTGGPRMSGAANAAFMWPAPAGRNSGHNDDAPEAGSGSAKPFSWEGVKPDSFGYTGPKPEDRSGRSNDAAGGKRSPVADRMAAAREGVGEESSDEIDKVGKSARKAGGHVMSLGHAFGMVQNAGFQMAAVGGLMAGVTSEAMKLANSTTGMGLNFAGMSKGIENAEQSAARSHNLGLNGLDQSLRQSARAMTNELAPAMKDGVTATKAFEQAKMGAQGSLGPSISGFANQLTQSAPQLQSIMGSIGKAALGLGADVVAGVAQTGPAWASMADSVTRNGPQIAQFSQDFSRTAAWVGSKAASLTGAVEDAGNWGLDLTDQMAGIRTDPNTGAVKEITAPKSDSPPGLLNSVLGPGLTRLISGPPQPAAAPTRASGSFDPSKPFSGTAIGPDGAETVGPGEPTAASKAAAGGAYHPSKDADWSKAMTGKQIYDQQYKNATGGLSGQPQWDGLGGTRPGGPGSSSGGRQVPSSIASGLGMGGGSAIPSLMASMQSQVGSGGGGLGQAVEQHITKAVHQASPAASAGGAAIGGALNTGIAQGHQSTQSVVDTVVIKHSKHIVDLASAALGVHSPSTEFDYLGQMSQRGFGQGWVREASNTVGAMSGVFSAQQKAALKNSPDYDGSPGVTVSVPKPNQAMQYSSRLANANIASHNDRAASLAAGREDQQRQAIGGMTHDERAGQLAQGRSDLHERALANLGIPGHVRPSGNVNPFDGDKHPSLLNTIKNEGPLGDLKAHFAQHGENMTQGVSVGIDRGTPAAQNQMSQFSQRMQNQHKRDNGINSPSTVYAGDGMDMAAGVGVGFAGGASSAASVMAAAGQAMSLALQGPMDDYGLQVGMTYAQAFADGSSREIKTANFSALGLPSNLNPAAMSDLAATGLLRAGSGASTWKTSSGGVGTVTLPAPAPPQTITIQVQHMEGDRMAGIADQQIELAFNQLTGTYQTL